MIKRTRHVAKKSEAVTLKVVAQRVGLAMGTVSVILNRAPQAKAIPQQTRDRVFAAALRMNYHPNPFARALRTKHISAAGIERSGVSGSRALVFEGADDFLRAVNAIRQAGLRVPGDVAVIGADVAAVS